MSHPQLIGFPIVLERQVSWGEMDSFQHVNNVVYFRYFEDSRIEYMAQIGWFELLGTEGFGPIVASTNARFRRPVKYPDTLYLAARIINIEQDRVTFEHRIISQAWNDLCTSGDAVVVNYDYRNMQKAALPQSLRDKIDAMEKKS